MAIDLDFAKDWLKVDWDDEDKIIQFLIDDAKEDLLKAGIKERESKVYDRAILMLVSNRYYNRTGSDNSNDIQSKPIQDAILKLKAEGNPDDEEATS